MNQGWAGLGLGGWITDRVRIGLDCTIARLGVSIKGSVSVLASSWYLPLPPPKVPCSLSAPGCRPRISGQGAPSRSALSRIESGPHTYQRKEQEETRNKKGQGTRNKKHVRRAYTTTPQTTTPQTTTPQTTTPQTTHNAHHTPQTNTHKPLHHTQTTPHTTTLHTNYTTTPHTNTHKPLHYTQTTPHTTTLHTNYTTHQYTQTTPHITTHKPHHYSNDSLHQQPTHMKMPSLSAWVRHRNSPECDIVIESTGASKDSQERQRPVGMSHTRTWPNQWG